MQAITRAGVVASVAASALVTVAAVARAGSGGGPGYCYVDMAGTVVTVQCASGSGSSGSGGSGAGHVHEGCTIGAALTQAQAEQYGLQWPPPTDYSWAFMDCVGGRTAEGGPQAVLVNNVTGAPSVSPQDLLAEALSELQIPILPVRTAPPRGRDGLVGLPEWFWIPADRWHARSVTVQVGSVWATAVAAPVSLVFDPGAGLTPVSCAGPGTAYDPARSASAQHTDCSYTYAEPSAGQPGAAFRAAVIVAWRVSWTGSGGSGGVIDAALQIPAGFGVRVAQGEALVSSP
jgi:hypothetical protein